MSNQKRPSIDGTFKVRAVALAEERINVAQAARDLEIGRCLLSARIAAA